MEIFSDQYCHTLRCSIDELCVVNVKTARCIKNDKLHDVYVPDYCNYLQNLFVYMNGRICSLNDKFDNLFVINSNNMMNI